MDDLLGWQNTRWGMGSNEIIVAVGHQNIQETERMEYKDTYASLVIPQTRIGPYEFTVIFQQAKFGGRLAQVFIQHEADPTAPPDAVVAKAKELLTERYGEPTRVATSDDFVWVFPTTSICLSAVYIEDIASTVSVTFYPTTQARVTEIAAF